MIKALGFNSGRPTLVLGLSRGNCERLLAGKPIVIDMQDMLKTAKDSYDMNNSQIVLFAGESEESMVVALGMEVELPPDTYTHEEEN